MTRDLAIGLAAGLIALAATRWAGDNAPGRPAPPGVYQARLDESGSRAAADALADPFTERALTKLDARLPDVRRTDVRLDELLAYVEEAGGVDLAVDWRALEDAATVKRDSPVTLDLKAPTVAQALRAALAAAAGDRPPPAVYVDVGLVRVVTPEQFAARTVTRVYDVRDLIDDAVRLGGGSTTSGAAGEPAANGRYPSRQAVLENVQARAVEELLALVGKADDSGVGRANTSALRYFAGRLIVEATPAEHARLANLLQALRGKRP